MGMIRNFIKLKKLNRIIKRKLSDIKVPEKCEIKEREYLVVKKGINDAIDIAISPIIRSLLLNEIVTENYVNNACNAFWNYVSNNVIIYLFSNNRITEKQKKELYTYIDSIKETLRESFKEIL